MAGTHDVERGEDYREYDSPETLEQEALLPTSSEESSESKQHLSPYALTHCTPSSKPRFGFLHLLIAFFAGAIACLTGQYATCGSGCFLSQNHGSTADRPEVAFLPPITTTDRHHFPPASPTNAFPSMFPTGVGYAGPTPTGAEPALIMTAPSYPIQAGADQLVVPPFGNAKKTKSFDLYKTWGNLSPWYSVGRTAFGLDSAPEPPETCRITGLHLLHRHGARYPTEWAREGVVALLANRAENSIENFKATGDLEFLNDWTYKLGEEVLTPFGRKQSFDLGIAMRLKYGFLLKNFTETNTIPVFRTESQDRMLNSAINFAMGFFGYPLEHKYQQSITIESHGINNSLAPYHTCSNANVGERAGHTGPYTSRWSSIYLKDTLARLQPLVTGYELTVRDLYAFQELCAYETVALGYSKFCGLFTADEWEGFHYTQDLYFWYSSAFGSPLARAQGIGYIQELVARLTHTPIETHNSSTNSTLDGNPITFPLDHALYVDATHDVVILNVIAALNLSNFAATGPLPADHIPPNRSFKSSELAPFTSNIQFQLLSCTSVPGPQIRVIINDGVTPLTGIKGCAEQKDGMCPVDAFVAGQKEIIRQTDWNYDCKGEWEIPEGWKTTTGDTPK